MTKEEIQERYKTIILPESKAPYHFEKTEGTDILQAYNPMCGDKYSLYLRNENPLGDIYFHGFGCAISKASTSLMLRSIEGRSRTNAIDFCKAFLEALESGVAPEDFPEGLKVMTELKQFEGRMECIQLSWKALLQHMESLPNQIENR